MGLHRAARPDQGDAKVGFEQLAGLWGRTVYRIRQFFQGVHAQISRRERQLVAANLPVKAQALFADMPADVQRHSLNVLYTLQQAGYRDPDLAAAALLHDAGKVAARDGGVALGLWLRGPLVLLETFWPNLMQRTASPQPSTSWRYAMYVHIHHPRIGAAQAAVAGCSDLACWLIRHHQDPLPVVAHADAGERRAAYTDRRRQLLAALQWADGQN